MLRRGHPEREENPPHNKVFSSWSPEELYHLCVSAAEKTCEKYGYPREREDIAQELWIYLWEQGHVLRCPEHKGAIYNFLTRLCRDNLRKIWKYDGKHTSIDREDSEEPDLPAVSETAEKMLEGIAAEELLKRIMRQARSDQIPIIKSLAAGATQTEVAQSRGVKQYQISRWLTALRQRIRE